jgi:hypothetical protein
VSNTSLKNPGENALSLFCYNVKEEKSKFDSIDTWLWRWAEEQYHGPLNFDGASESLVVNKKMSELES